MIVPYYGLFLTSQIPLELSIGKCSYACEYCFERAKVNKTNDISISQILSIFKTKSDRNTLVKYLIDEGYPVCFSNKTDPFCHYNLAQSIKIVELFSELKTPIYFQTKGFCKPIKEVKEFIKSIPPSCWYITITSLDERIREKFEINAPKYADRLELIELLVSLGHSVSVGLNPLVENWVGGLSGAEKLFLKLKSMGVHGVAIELLHLSKTMISIFNKKIKDKFTEEILLKYKSQIFNRDNHEYQFFIDCKKLALSIGLQAIGGSELFYNTYYDSMKNKYNKLFPNYQNFFNWCYENKQDNDIVSFQDLLNHSGGIILSDNLKSSFFKSYIASNSKGILQQYKIHNAICMKDLMKFYWVDKRITNSIDKYPNFAYIYDSKDEYGLPLMRFSKTIYDELWVE